MARNQWGAKYTPEQRAAWGAAQDAARGDHMKGVNALPRAPNPFGREGTLANQIDKSAQAEVNRKIVENAPKHARFAANLDSDCLESLTWKDGIAHAVFLKRDDGSGYDYECAREEFLEWINSGSLGTYGNKYFF
jgi:hypothetical protein